MFPIEIVVPIVPPSPNQIYGRHWSKKYMHLRDWKEHIFYRLTKQNRDEIKSLNDLGYVLYLKIIQFRKRELDPDNLHGSVKIVLDAIVGSRLAIGDKKTQIQYQVEQLLSQNEMTKIRFDKEEIL